MFRKILPGIAMVFAATWLGACMPDNIEADVIEDTGGNRNTGTGQHDNDELTCAALEALVATDLPRSTSTAASDYVELSFEDWCARNITADNLEEIVGNAAAWTADETDPLVTATSPEGRAMRATLAQGARLDIHALDPRGTIPFVRKIHFASHEGESGSCALEMRVYQQDLGATGRKPLLYFHGGGWRNRSTTMTAAEILTTHLVDEHVVFMPAYPLHGDKDGPENCRDASFDDILAIAQQAFDWVVANKDVFGATGAEQIDVMGHSAGGQLAAWVATQNRARVGKLVNFYGPVEFAQFIDESDPGGRYENDFADSKELLASLLETGSLAALERPYPERVTQNSLTEIIRNQGSGAVPPFFMVQGNADTTVPVEQALLACNALGGRASAAGGVFDCPNDSHVAIIDGAGHNLDRRCIGDEWPLYDSGEDAENMMDTICPTGDIDHEAARAAIRAAFEWLDE